MYVYVNQTYDPYLELINIWLVGEINFFDDKNQLWQDWTYEMAIITPGKYYTAQLNGVIPADILLLYSSDRPGVYTC